MKCLDPELKEKSILDIAIQQFPKVYKAGSVVHPIFYQTISSLVDTPLTFPGNLTPFKRCLAFHATRALYEAKHIHKWKISEEDDAMDVDAWSRGISERPELRSQIDSWIGTVS